MILLHTDLHVENLGFYATDFLLSNFIRIFKLERCTVNFAGICSTCVNKIVVAMVKVASKYNKSH